MKTLLTYVAIVIIQLVAFLPLPVSRFLGASMGRLLWALNSSMAKISKVNIERCFPDYSPEQVNALAKQSLIETGKTLFEIGMCWVWPPAWALKRITKVTGEEHLHAALAKNQGIIVIAPHLGNWEILNHFFRLHTEMTVMFKSAKVPVFDDWMQRVRKRTGLFLVPANKQGVLALFDLLENNKVVAVLPDQEPSRKSGVFAPFYAQQALTGKLIGELANKNPDSPMLCCYAKRMADGNYEVVYLPANEGIRSDDPQVAATALNQSIEECVSDCPEQYQWSYKRFRLQPEGKTHFYK